MKNFQHQKLEELSQFVKLSKIDSISSDPFLSSQKSRCEKNSCEKRASLSADTLKNFEAKKALLNKIPNYENSEKSPEIRTLRALKTKLDQKGTLNNNEQIEFLKALKNIQRKVEEKVQKLSEHNFENLGSLNRVWERSMTLLAKNGFLKPKTAEAIQKLNEKALGLNKPLLEKAKKLTDEVLKQKNKFQTAFNSGTGSINDLKKQFDAFMEKYRSKILKQYREANNHAPYVHSLHDQWDKTYQIINDFAQFLVDKKTGKVKFDKNGRITGPLVGGSAFVLKQGIDVSTNGLSPDVLEAQRRAEAKMGGLEVNKNDILKSVPQKISQHSASLSHILTKIKTTKSLKFDNDTKQSLSRIYKSTESDLLSINYFLDHNPDDKDSETLQDLKSQLDSIKRSVRIIATAKDLPALKEKMNEEEIRSETSDVIFQNEFFLDSKTNDEIVASRDPEDIPYVKQDLKLLKQLLDDKISDRKFEELQNRISETLDDLQSNIFEDVKFQNPKLSDDEVAQEVVDILRNESLLFRLNQVRLGIAGNQDRLLDQIEKIKDPKKKENSPFSLLNRDLMDQYDGLKTEIDRLSEKLKKNSK